jgi:hypothetical protein
VEALLGVGLLAIATVAERLELLPRDRVLPGFLAKARAWVKAPAADQ